MEPTPKIGFIGCGRMAQALIRGLIAGNVFTPTQIAATDVSGEMLAAFARETGVTALPSVESTLSCGCPVLLAIKPQNFGEFSQDAQPFFTTRHLLISIVTGVSLAKLSALTPLAVRVMPNTPALVGVGAAGFCATPAVSPEQIAFAKTVFDSVGMAAEVDESLMDAVTGLSGSGPAYIYLIIEALAQAGVKNGLPEQLALALATQTVKGAALMVEKTGLSPEALRNQVTSPGGTTLEGLKVLESRQIREIIEQTVQAAADRSKVLGKQ
ncbi:pyrroline-5-carboxylate reductase [Oscillatoria laete-virens NRMC-F 0139]|nr:pyrroline-5-carboxylate reductase [Oscillatoria laete-virens]MDL5053070.1 pyrroline-5-carboxylate reductase [Oscillatoria laete-virens NRMC-F 0139]